MIKIINSPQKTSGISLNSWTIEDFTNFVDTLDEGFHWMHITGQAVRRITGDTRAEWAICFITKRFTNASDLVLCEFHNVIASVPVYVLAKKGDSAPYQWEESCSIRGTT